jgi:hypothetical protein
MGLAVWFYLSIFVSPLILSVVYSSYIFRVIYHLKQGKDSLYIFNFFVAGTKKTSLFLDCAISMDH